MLLLGLMVNYYARVVIILARRQQSTLAVIKSTQEIVVLSFVEFQL